jgi:uncharacterized protein with PQ loop repeat
VSEYADIINAISLFIAQNGSGLTLAIFWILLFVALVWLVVKYLLLQINTTNKEHKKIDDSIADVKEYVRKQQNIQSIETNIVSSVTYNADKIIAHIDGVYTDQLESSYKSIMEHITRLDDELTHVADTLRTLLDQAQFGRAEDTKQLASTLEAIRRDLTSLATSIRTTINILIDKKIGDD